MSEKPKSVPRNGRINAADIPVTNPHGLSSVYANNIGISATMLDFTILFIETGQLPGENGSIAKTS